MFVHVQFGFARLYQCGCRRAGESRRWWVGDGHAERFSRLVHMSGDACEGPLADLIAQGLLVIVKCPDQAPGIWRGRVASAMVRAASLRTSSRTMRPASALG